MSETTTVEPTNHKLEGKKISRKAVLVGSAVVTTLTVVAISLLKKNRNNETTVLEPLEGSTEA